MGGSQDARRILQQEISRREKERKGAALGAKRRVENVSLRTSMSAWLNSSPLPWKAGAQASPGVRRPSVPTSAVAGHRLPKGPQLGLSHHLAFGLHHRSGHRHRSRQRHLNRSTSQSPASIPAFIVPSQPPMRARHAGGVVCPSPFVWPSSFFYPRSSSHDSESRRWSAHEDIWWRET